MNDDQLYAELEKACALNVPVMDMKAKLEKALKIVISNSQWDEVFFFRFIVAGGRIAVSGDNVVISACPVPVQMAAHAAAANRAFAPTTRKKTPSGSSARILKEMTKAHGAPKKSEIVDVIDEQLDKKLKKESDRITQKQIGLVLDELAAMMAAHLSPAPKGPGKFTIPGLLTLETKIDKDTSKPTVHVRPLKKLKDAME